MAAAGRGGGALRLHVHLVPREVGEYYITIINYLINYLIVIFYCALRLHVHLVPREVGDYYYIFMNYLINYLIVIFYWCSSSHASLLTCS